VTLASTITATAALTLYTALTLPGASPALPAASPGGGASVTFTNAGPLRFEANTAQFRDPTAAETALTRFVGYLVTHPGTGIEVSGTTSREGDLAYDMALSLARARAVTNVLVSLGAVPSQIMTRGLAWQFPGYVNDQGPNGTILPGPAEQNRSIIITQL
jgi:outer membrane protein OmpA-like peptidoglycan-associated protein